MIARKSRSALSGDPRTTFIIGTHNRKYRCLGEHSLHESVLPTQGDYDKVIGRVFENVDKEYLPVLQNITSCERLKLFLAEGDHKEITYHCSGEEKPWRRVIFNCILREGGEPLLIAMTFFI